MSQPTVKVSNHQSSIVGSFITLFIICWIMFVSGCDECKGTSSATQCTGKAIGLIYKDLKFGFEKGSQ
jgi:hypothetical protein